MTISFALGGAVLTAGTAQADGCYTWTRTLKPGATGNDVTQLQIRVAGYPGYNAVLAIDGSYGPATTAAVKRFQAAYGLAADGVSRPRHPVQALRAPGQRLHPGPLHVPRAEQVQQHLGRMGRSRRARPRPTR